jgi:PST family polysaccharide transporter
MTHTENNKTWLVASMYSNLQKLLKWQSERLIFSKFIHLLFARGLQYIAPLITMPYLFRVLGPERYGIIAFAESLTVYGIVITNFGFQITATREIAIESQLSRPINKIFTSVYEIKLLLFVIYAILFVVGIISVRTLRDYWEIHLIYLGLVAGNVLFPAWLYYGVRRMEYVATFNMLNSFLYAVSIFMFVHSPKDWMKVVIFRVCCYLLVAICALIVAIHTLGLRWHHERSTVQYLTKKSYSFFLSRIAVALYGASNNVLLGMILGMKEVAYYSVADKLTNLLRSPFDIANDTIFPFIINTNSKSIKRNIILISLSTSISVVLVFSLCADQIISVVAGRDYAPAVQVFRILVLKLLFVSVHIFVGSCFLLPNYDDYSFNSSVCWAFGIYLLTVDILFLSGKVGTVSLSCAVVMVDFVILIVRLYCGLRRDLL